METAKRRCRSLGWAADGSVTVPRAMVDHLHEALEQMDLLLQTQQAEAALPHLVCLLQHLRALRPVFA